MPTMAPLLALGAQRVLSGKHHGGSAGSEPRSLVVGAFGADDAANGHEETVWQMYH